MCRKQTLKITKYTVKPPLWLNALISLCYGMITFSWASMRHENLWMLGLIVSAAGFLLSMVFYLYTLRLLGVKPKLSPKSKPEFKFQIFLALLFAAIIGLSRGLSLSSFWWASYLGGVANTILLAYSLHNYATGEYVAKVKSDE